MDNELQLFEQHALQQFEQLAELKRQSDKIAELEKKVKADIQIAMEKYNVKSFKNDFLTISYVEESTSTNVDLKALEMHEPELYKELLTDYPKTTNKKAYVRFTVK